MIHVLVFSSLLYLLLNDYIERLESIAIDPEYPGYEAVIKNRVLTLCRNRGKSVYRDQINFVRVGKKSPAHDVGYRVYKGKQQPDKRVTVQDVMATLGG